MYTIKKVNRGFGYLGQFVMLVKDRNNIADGLNIQK